jgi:hypothetical protein
MRSLAWRKERRELRSTTGVKGRADDYLSKLVRGFRWRDLVWLARADEMLENIYLVKMVAGVPKASHPEAGVLPWHVLLLLGSHSRKFIFSPRRVTWKLMHKYLADFRNRAWWQNALRDAEPSAKPLLPRDVPHCSKTVPAQIADMVAGVKKIVVQAAKPVVDRRSLRPAFVRAAVRTLSSESVVVKVSDKDGVLVLVHESTLKEMVQKEFQKPFYRPYGTLNLPSDLISLSSGFLGLARVLDKFNKSWAREVRCAVGRISEKNLVGRLVVTVKTHKDPVTVRLLHSSRGNPLNPISSAINRMLTPLLRRLPHLCLGSDQVAERIRGVFVGSRAVLLKFDVVDFYLSGEHGFITNTIKSCVASSEEQAFLESALGLVLGFQYVENSVDPALRASTVFRVTRGSGIGMVHSGAVADLCFAKTVEEPVLARCVELGVSLYLRFRDDVFVVCKEPSSARNFIDSFVERSGVFCEVKLEKVSLVSVPFLDFCISKSDDGYLDFSPYVKPTARHLPLSSDSCHPRSVHASWPVAECRRMFKRASCADLALAWVAAKISRWRHHLLDESILRRCERLVCCMPSQVAKSAVLELASRDCSVETTRVRLVLPFRPEFASLPGRLKAFLATKNGHYLQTIGRQFDVQICWCRAGRAMAQLFN